MDIRRFFFFSVILVFTLAESAKIVLDDFEESASSWKWSRGLYRTTDPVKVGTAAGLWNDTVLRTTVSCSNITHDWSPFDHVHAWIYSVAPTMENVYFLAFSESSTTTGLDYFSSMFPVDWTGWREFQISLSQFGTARSPRGWDQIDSISFSSAWGTPAVPGTVLCLDDLFLYNQQIEFLQGSVSYALVPGTEVTFQVLLRNPQAVASPVITLSLSDASPVTADWMVGGTPSTTITLSLAPNEVVMRPLRVQLSAGASAEEVGVAAIWASSGGSNVTSMLVTITSKTAPTAPPREHPFLFVSASEVPGLIARAAAFSWAGNSLNNVLGWGAKAFVTNVSVIPIEPSYWPGYYACDNGQYLKYDPKSPKSHYCQSEDRWYVGQPYDGGWVSSKHNENVDNALKAAQSFTFSGNASVGRVAAGILYNYALVYPSLPYHGTDGYTTLGVKSGGRIHSETLAEAAWAFTVAWTFDLVYPLMTDEERTVIEFNLLRPLVTTILRNDAGFAPHFLPVPLVVPTHFFQVFRTGKRSTTSESE